MKNGKSNKQRKKRIVFGAIVLSLFLLMAGTFAWRDYRQHKTNVMSGKGMARDVVLVENFNPRDGKDWTLADPTVEKQVSVKNVGKGNAIVRLSLKEYMELINGDIKTSNLRYMIDTNGDYVKVLASNLSENPTSEEIVQAFNEDEVFGQFVANLPNFNEYQVASKENNDDDASFRFHKLRGSSKGDEDFYYYIATRENDPNGQYGKHITFGYKDIDLNTDPIEGSIVTGGGENKDTRPNAHDNHHNESNAVCDLFEVININRPNHAVTEHAAKYIDIDYNEINYEDHYDDTKDYTEGKWILNGDYFYYSHALKPETSTGNLLNSLTLKIQPETGFLYQMHIDLEAVSFDEISDGIWDDVDVESEMPNIFENWEVDSTDKPAEEPHPAFPNTTNKDVGDTIRIADHDFTILYKDQDGKSLVQMMNNYRGILGSYYPNKNSTFSGVQGSNVQTTVNNWYRNVSDDEKQFILKHRIKDEQKEIELGKTDNTYKEENAYYSYPDETGVKDAFVLGVSDINKYIKEQYPDQELFIDKESFYRLEGLASSLLVNSEAGYWLRSPAASISGGSLDSAAVISAGGQFSKANLITGTLGARPSLWVQLEK